MPVAVSRPCVAGAPKRALPRDRSAFPFRQSHVESLLQLLLNIRDCQGAINAYESVERLMHAFEIGITNPDKEFRAFAFEPVRRFNASHAVPAHLRADIEQDRKIRLQLRMHPGLQCRELGFLHAPPSPLIGKACIRESIAQHAIPAQQCGRDDFLEVLSPGRKHKECLGFGMHLVLRLKQELADLLAQRRASGFARQREWHALRSQKIRGPGYVGAFTRAIDAFERYEQTAIQRRSWNLFTARLCSTRFEENW